MLKIVSFVLLASLAVPSVLGVCQPIETVKNFDVGAYMGLWYEIERFPTRYEPGGSCVTANYSLIDEAGESDDPVRVYNREFNEETGEYQDITGSARLADDSGDGKLSVSFDVAPFPAPYWIVDTDYTSFALVHSCVSIAGISSKSAWILSRKTTLSPESIQQVAQAIATNNIDGERFRPTRQDDQCIYS